MLTPFGKELSEGESMISPPTIVEGVYRQKGGHSFCHVPILLSSFLMTTDSLNISWGSYLKPYGMVTEVRDVHPENASLPMDVTLLPMVTETIFGE